MVKQAFDEKHHVEDHRTEEGSELGRTKTADTVHLDEAVKVVGVRASTEDWTIDEEKKLVRKIDWKVLPLLVTTIGIQFYDKAMLSHAVRTLTSQHKQR